MWSALHPDLTRIFPKSHVTPIMSSILNPPMLLIQVQQTLGFGFLSGQIGKPIDDLLTFFFPLFDEATNDEDLGNPSPFLLKPFVHLRTGPDFSHFQSSMPFVDRFVMVPFPLVKSLVLKKVHEILTHARLVLFRD